MIKGAQKRMIVVKTAESKVFEEAYFVLRRESGEWNGDMASEANRIIEGVGVRDKERGRGVPQRVKEVMIGGICFISGGAFAGAAVWALALLIAF
jgi:hypothetical protein